MIIGVVISSCNQKDETGQGDILVSINYTPSTNNGNWTFYLSEGYTVRLSSGGSVIATQYTNGNGTFNIGKYNYGDYSINVTGTQGGIYYTGTNNPNYGSLSQTKTLALDKPPKP